MQIFFSSKYYTVQCSPGLVESLDAEWPIQRNHGQREPTINYMLIFECAESQHPQMPHCSRVNSNFFSGSCLGCPIESPGKLLEYTYTWPHPCRFWSKWIRTQSKAPQVIQMHNQDWKPLLVSGEHSGVLHWLEAYLFCDSGNSGCWCRVKEVSEQSWFLCHPVRMCKGKHFQLSNRKCLHAFAELLYQHWARYCCFWRTAKWTLVT